MISDKLEDTTVGTSGANASGTSDPDGYTLYLVVTSEIRSSIVILRNLLYKMSVYGDCLKMQQQPPQEPVPQVPLTMMVVPLTLSQSGY